MKNLFMKLGIIIAFIFLVLAFYVPNIPDPPTKYPAGELGKMIKLGENIIMHTDTHPLTKDLVGNKLQCNSCHFDGGKTKSLGSFIGTARAFPAYSKREKSVQTLQDRINNCFMRSMNGKRPIVDTKASVAMAAYITWLSEGLPITLNSKKPVNPYFTKVWPNKKTIPLVKKATHKNYLNGKKVFMDQCSDCHGENGLGTDDGPPVWGPNSYNTGAGLSKPNKMATWIKADMPLDDPTLTLQEAVDVAIYIDAQEHPDFDLTKHMFPKEEMGYYNSKVLTEKHSVRSNFKKPWNLDIDVIRGDHKIK